MAKLDPPQHASQTVSVQKNRHNLLARHGQHPTSITKHRNLFVRPRTQTTGDLSSHLEALSGASKIPEVRPTSAMLSDACIDHNDLAATFMFHTLLGSD